MGMNEDISVKEVEQFILQEMDTVPHLEALLLLWNSRPKEWTVEEMARALYVAPGTAHSILQRLARRGLIAASRGETESYCYEPASSKRDSLIEAVEATYRRDLIRIARMIHAAAKPAVREFAEAFRFKKDGE
jgi:DNA-binding MarR family transcriptional regulator